MLGKAVFRGFYRMFRCVLFASVLGVFCGIYAASAYTVTYNCGFYDSGTTPPAQDTATDNTSFTPAANTCLPTNGATFAGWVVSGTGDVKQSGESFVWNYDEDKTFTAIWNCYWNSDETECVPGYTITLSKNGCSGVWVAPVPDKIYTIQGRGVYIGPERTENQLMEYRRSNDPNHPGKNPIKNPYLRFEYDLDVTLYAPTNPVTGQSYVVEQPDPVVQYFTFYFSNPLYFDAGGYITQNAGLANISQDKTIYAGSGGGCGDEMSRKSGITGYTISWYDTNGNEITQKPCSSDCSAPRTGILYAKWSPISYGIEYNLNGGEWGENVDVVGTAEYDKEFKVEHPVHNDGYIFAGWDIGTLDVNTHYYSDSHIFVNGVYQSGTTQTSSEKSINGTKAKYFMNLRSASGTYNLKFTAQWECDTSNGYHWDTESETCTNVYNITYHNVDSDWISDQPVSYTYGNATQIRTPGKTGYVFLGWCVNDENCANYENNVNYTIPATSNTDIDLYAQWDCDNANNWWWNADNTACVQGYTIQLHKGICQTFSDFEPVYIYTIPTRGAYLDAERTLLMTENENPVQVPYKAPIVIDYNTNAPNDPATNPSIQYTTSPSSVSSITRPYTCGNFRESSASDFVLNGNGYITTVGSDEAKTYSSNKIWRANGWGCGSGYHNPTLTLTGYTHDGWYDNPQGTGTNIDYIGCSGSGYAVSGTLYAHWTPNTYDVVYNPGAHAASGSTAYTDTDGATYDSPYMPLSFGASPISNNMSASSGYVFVGWTTDSTPTFTNGILNNEYTGDTYWKRDSGLTLYAAYDCDVENGYHWNNNECVLNMSTVTYYSGNCDPNNVKNPFGNTYSATDLNSAVIGQPYNVLSYTNTSLVGDNFGYMYGSVADGGFGVPYACASFHGWNNPNIQGTDKDYTGCFSEQNGLCTPVIQSYNYDGGLNLYAYCEWGKWNVAYHDCNGELLYTQAMQFGDSFWTPSASDISGYTFNGWMFNNETLGKTFTADLCLKGQNLNLYANCKPNVYPVNLKWVADGDTYNQNPDTCDYGTSTISGISHPDIPGYTFTGWKVTNWE